MEKTTINNATPISLLIIISILSLIVGFGFFSSHYLLVYNTFIYMIVTIVFYFYHKKATKKIKKIICKMLEMTIIYCALLAVLSFTVSSSENAYGCSVLLSIVFMFLYGIYSFLIIDVYN